MEVDEADPVPLLVALSSAPAPPPTSSSSASSAAPRPATSIDWPSYDACVTVDPRNNRYKQVRNQDGIVVGQLQPLLPTSGKYRVFALCYCTAHRFTRCSRGRGWREGQENPYMVDRVLAKWLLDGHMYQSTQLHMQVERH